MKHANPLNTPEAAALLKDKGALKQLLSSPEAKQLMGLLSAKDTSQLKHAAEQARQGDSTALRSVAQGILDRPESAALLRQLEQSLPGKKG